ncbi:MAG: hypothetical protein DMF53_13055 [Acidobacteria bacterium]|nr:MAG: hypothetical protein DMF53_13055 [Acidobacteriota bacterium]
MERSFGNCSMSQLRYLTPASRFSCGSSRLGVDQGRHHLRIERVALGRLEDHRTVGALRHLGLGLLEVEGDLRHLQRLGLRLGDGRGRLGGRGVLVVEHPLHPFDRHRHRPAGGEQNPGLIAVRLEPRHLHHAAVHEDDQLGAGRNGRQAEQDEAAGEEPGERGRPGAVLHQDEDLHSGRQTRACILYGTAGENA